MPFTETATERTLCDNRADCAQAVAGTSVAWYPGAGEYCPECGGTLALPAAVPADVASVPVEPPPPARLPLLDAPPRTVDLERLAIKTRGRRRAFLPVRWFSVVVVAIVAAAAVGYFGHHDVAPDPPAVQTLSVCPTPSVRGLAAALVRAYAQKSGLPLSRFRLADATTCDVRFSTALQTPDAVIGRDAIVAIVNARNPIKRLSENQLRAIFSGAIHDWSRVGGPHARIVPMLTDPASDEAQALGASLFYGVSIDRGVRRAGTSAEIARIVSGGRHVNRASIALVALSRAVRAKIVPLAYLPALSKFAIASRRYPYLLTIGVDVDSTRDESAAAGLVAYARSSDAAAIVSRNGLVGRAGF